MPFDINTVLMDMRDAAIGAVKDDLEAIPGYLLQIFENEKNAFHNIAEARLDGSITEAEFENEIEREKKVLEVELLTVSIITKAAAQKAINAAMNILKDAVRLAL